MIEDFEDEELEHHQENQVHQKDLNSIFQIYEYKMVK